MNESGESGTPIESGESGTPIDSARRERNLSAAKLVRRHAPAAALRGDLHPLLRRVYSHRGVSAIEEIDAGLADLAPPDAIKGMDDAVNLLLAALRGQWKILLVGDYDADGAASCALALEALHGFGFDHLDYIVPNRFEYGYGLTPAIVELARARGPDLLITVDNGISSLDGVAAAAQAGLKVLVTDHHLPAARLPAADAIVNPNQPGCAFPAKHTAGVGVIFYVMLGLRRRLREANWFGTKGPPEPNLAELLDLVALGTIADVVSFDRNNRILVREGLRRIRAGRARPGVRALLKVAGRNQANAVAADLAFGVAPRLNAAGRLTDMSAGIECLMAEDEHSARELAKALDEINRERREIQAEMDEQAAAMVAELAAEAAALRHPAARDGEAAVPAGETAVTEGETAEATANASESAGKLPAGICFYQPGWHQGVVGIVASRIKDRLHRPVIAFAADGANAPGELKGSGRSISGFHIRDALDAIAGRHPGLVTRFGGHAMAAGLSLQAERFEEFRAAFAAEAARQLKPEQLEAKLLSDGPLEPQWFSLEVALMLRNAGPWGKDFPEPVFDGRFRLRRQQPLKEKHLRMSLSPLEDPDMRVEAVAFNVEDWPDPQAAEISLAYRLEVNEFRGERNPQLVVERFLTESLPD